MGACRLDAADLGGADHDAPVVLVEVLRERLGARHSRGGAAAVPRSPQRSTALQLRTTDMEVAPSSNKARGELCISSVKSL